jgi:hypothetical protein
MFQMQKSFYVFIQGLPHGWYHTEYMWAMLSENPEEENKKSGVKK